MAPIDHFYVISTSKNRDTISRYTGVGGYSLYREPEGYVYWWQQTGTVPIYQYRHLASGDHYYNTSGNFIAGYASDGIAWYMYPNQVAGTVPLYQLWGNGDHFYTTDPDGEMINPAREDGPAQAYLETVSKPFMSGYERDAVGILGYLWPNQQTGSDPLLRLFQQNAEGYTLDGTTLKTKIWNPKANEMRESKLDLTQCLKIRDSELNFLQIPTNLDKVSTYIEERNGANLKRIYDEGDLTLALGGTSRIHSKLVSRRHLIPDAEDNSWVELEPYLRRTYDGYLEWLYE